MTSIRLGQAVLSFGLLLALSVLVPLTSQRDPNFIDIDHRLIGPSRTAWFGTDDLGRDVLSRTLHGFARTVTVSILATISATALGVFPGALAGWYYRSWFDGLFNWMASLVTGLPFLLVMAAVLSLTTPSLEKAYLALTCLIWVGPARLVRADVIKTTPLDYVAAARALGTPEWRILAVHVMPACVSAPLIHAVSYLPEVIALEAGLSFLGLGVQPPDPGLGKMVFDGLNYLGSAWWLAVFPALALAAVVNVVNVVVWHLLRDARQAQ